MTDSNQHQRRIEWTLFGVSFLTFAYFYQAADQSTAARFDLMRSILERHTLAIDGYAGYNTADIIQLGGHIFSVKAPGGALTGIVQWSILSKLLAPLLTSNEPLYWALLTHLTIVFSTGLAIALMAVVCFRFALLLGASAGRAASLAIVLSFGTIVFPYATEMTGEPIAAAATFAAFYLLVTSRGEAGPERALVAGMLAGWAVLCDYPAILIAVALSVYALVKLKRWQVLSFAAGAAGIAMILLAYNKAAFGGPFFMSYEAYKLPGNTQFPEQAVGFVGLTYPKLYNLWKILIDPQRGLFFCNPVLLVTIPALVCFGRERRWRAEFGVTLFAVAGLILFNASFGESIVSWGGGTATGPRQIVAAIPFMVLALAFVPSRWDYLLGALGLFSIFIMLMATSVNPHFPYEYGNPVWEYAAPAYFRGDFAYNRDTYFGGGSIVGDSVAFNLGKFAGLPPALQLVPLAILWIAAALLLMRELRPSIRSGPMRAALAIAAAAFFVPPVVGAIAARSGLAASHGLLARYYTGLNPGNFPPHIVRIDPRLEFNNVAQLGGLPFPSCVIWNGAILIPRPGLYRFTMDVDDAGWLTIDGRTVIRDPGNVNKSSDEGAIFLGPGRHPIEVGERNLAGDAALRLYWQTPGKPGPVIVPGRALIPSPAYGK
jgi:PA14 domain